MDYLDSIEITWDESNTLFDGFGESCETNQHNIEQQNLNVILTKKKASLGEIVNGLIGVMGLGLAIQDNVWYKLMVGIFAIAIVSPINIRMINHPLATDILDLIDSEYGDQYLDVEKLGVLYSDKPEMKVVVEYFIRKGLLEKEQDGRHYFVSNVIKNFEMKFLGA